VLERLKNSWGRSLQSLPTRMILSVSAAALVATLAVAWISTSTIESFLREKIDQKFPSILRSTGGRLDLWYSQRQLDISTFARSSTVVENIGRLAAGQSAARRERAEHELRQYLDYVLERFPQYDALFVLDRRGEPLLWVGREVELPIATRKRLAALESPRIGPVTRPGSHRIQIISSPAQNIRGRSLGALHGLVSLEKIEGILYGDGLGTTGEIFVVDSDRRYVTLVHDGEQRLRWSRPLPNPGAGVAVENYTNESNKVVVGAAMRFERFGWTLVVEEAYEEAFAPVVAAIRRILAINLAIVAACALIAFQMARSIVRPIRALSAAARWIAAGETDVELPESSSRGEIGVLTRAFKEMTARLSGKHEELQRMNEVLEQLSITDELTRLHNHRFFQDHLRREMKRAARTGQPLCLVLVDIDDFKALNDRFGHAAGDRVLHQVAGVMNAEIRETDLLARYGGEEFALLASQTPLDGAVAIAEKIRMAVARTSFVLDDEGETARVEITVSIGVVKFRGDEKAFFNDADRALYRAKGAGKDCVMSEDA